MNNLEQLRLLTGDSDVLLLSSILLRAENFIMFETRRTKLNEQLEKIQLEIALQLYNRLGSEAETSRSEGGISISYSQGISKEIINALSQYKLARVGGYAFEKK